MTHSYQQTHSAPACFGIELESSSITIKNKAAPYLFQTFLSSWCRVRLGARQRIRGEQCIALSCSESSTIRSCVVDNFWKGREREGGKRRRRRGRRGSGGINWDGDKLQTKGIVLAICPSAMSGATMARRIAVIEIRPRWARERKKRGKKSAE